MTTQETTAHAKTPVPEQRELMCKLTEPELLTRGEDMAAAELQIAALKEQRRGLNGKIAAQRTTRAKLAAAIEEGEESRMVDCEWADDFEHNVFRCKRKDTGVEIATRTMTVDDRQMALEIDEVTGEVTPAEPANDNAEAGPGDEGDWPDSDDDDDDESAFMPTEIVRVGPEVVDLDAQRAKKRKGRVHTPTRAAAKRPPSASGGKGGKNGKRSKSTRHTHS